MRPQLILVLLLLSAAALGGAVAYTKRPKAPAAAAQAESQPLPASKSAAPKDQGNGSNGQPQATTAAPAFNWTQIESPEYPAYIANLRALGCPEQTLRDIIISDINKLYAPKEAPLKLALKTRQAATGNATTTTVTDPNGNTTTTPTSATAAEARAELEVRKQLRAIQLEKKVLVKQLLGVDLPVDVLRGSTRRNYDDFDAAFRGLPEGKRELVQNLQETYWQQSDLLKEKYNNKRTDDWAAEYAQLNSKLREDLKVALGPQELIAYDSRSSSTGRRLETQLQGYQLSPDEYQRAVEIMNQFEEQTGRVGGKASFRTVDAETRAAAQKQMEDQMRFLLGNRYDDYEKQKDPGYQAVSAVAQRYQIPQAQLDQVYALQTAAKKDLTPPPNTPITPELQAQIMQKAKEIETQVGTLLGTNALQSLKRFRPNLETDAVFSP